MLEGNRDNTLCFPMRSAFSPTATSSLSPYLGFLEGFCVVGNAACRVFFSPFRPPLYAALCFVGECGKTDEVSDSSEKKKKKKKKKKKEKGGKK